MTDESVLGPGDLADQWKDTAGRNRPNNEWFGYEEGWSRDTGTRGPDGKSIIITGAVLQIRQSPDSMVVVAGNSICKFSRLL